MPIYEFRCTNCGHIQEILVTGSSDKKIELRCEECSSEVLERVMSAASYTIGSDRGATPRVTSKSCGSGNSCTTIDLPGHSKP